MPRRKRSNADEKSSTKRKSPWVCAECRKKENKPENGDDGERERMPPEKRPKLEIDKVTPEPPANTAEKSEPESQLKSEKSDSDIPREKFSDEFISNQENLSTLKDKRRKGK
ncbi:uncharacterized protein LOC106668151 [Cimex lectularius]|uniref:Uncharacterized protein n=1 Tax=Cimex lectularius TaxID=79782 RepID=A0A8I6RVH7_CIMLE|nr:uncharacterized protein LOC106668151 [Cimex lectularius]